MPYFNVDGLNRTFLELQKHYVTYEADDFLDKAGRQTYAQYNEKIENERERVEARCLKEGFGQRPPSRFREAVLARIVSPIQIALVGIDTLISQTARGILLCIGGIATLDGRKFKVGFIDLISVVIQLAVLPIIILISMISPRYAAWSTAVVIEKTQNKEWLDKHLCENPTDPLLRNNVQDRIFGVFVGLASIPVMLLRALLSFSINAVAFDLSGTLGSVGLGVITLFNQPSRTVRVTYREGVTKRLFYGFNGTYPVHPDARFFRILS